MVDPTTPTRQDIEQISSDGNGKINFRVVRALEQLFQKASVTLPDEISSLISASEGQAQQTSLDADYIDFSPNGPQEMKARRAKWSSGSGTVNLSLTDDNILQLGQKSQYRVENNSGALIERGKVVGINGANSNGYFGISLYTPGSAVDHSNELLGIVADDIANGEMGYVTKFGIVFGVDTSSWTAGTALYATTSGLLTNTRPTAPTLKVIVAYVSVQDATDGILHVKPYLGAAVSRLHDVNAPSPANGHILIWNNSNSRYEAAAISNGNGTTAINGAGSIQIDLNLAAGTGISITGTTTKTITNTAPAGGASGNFTTVDGKTVTVVGGLITTIV